MWQGPTCDDMVGILVVLILSWILLRWVAAQPITALGILPTPRRILEFTVGFVVMAVFAAINFVGQAHFQEIGYALNPDYGFRELLTGSWWITRAVLFEELVFRGAILLLLIKYVGVVRACVLGALAFGIYHWFSYGLLGGRLVVMIYVLLVTGSAGWMFSYAFARTRSLYTPLGLHLGWNVVAVVVFSTGPIGAQLLMPQGTAADIGGWATLLFFVLQAVVLPGLVTWYLLKRYRPRVDVGDLDP